MVYSISSVDMENFTHKEQIDLYYRVMSLGFTEFYVDNFWKLELRNEEFWLKEANVWQDDKNFSSLILSDNIIKVPNCVYGILNNGVKETSLIGEEIGILELKKYILDLNNCEVLDMGALFNLHNIRYICGKNLREVDAGAIHIEHSFIHKSSFRMDFPKLEPSWKYFSMNSYRDWYARWKDDVILRYTYSNFFWDCELVSENLDKLFNYKG